MHYSSKEALDIINEGFDKGYIIEEALLKRMSFDDDDWIALQKNLRERREQCDVKGDHHGVYHYNKLCTTVNRRNPSEMHYLCRAIDIALDKNDLEAAGDYYGDGTVFETQAQLLTYTDKLVTALVENNEFIIAMNTIRTLIDDDFDSFNFSELRAYYHEQMDVIKYKALERGCAKDAYNVNCAQVLSTVSLSNPVSPETEKKHANFYTSVCDVSLHVPPYDYRTAKCCLERQKEYYSKSVEFADQFKKVTDKLEVVEAEDNRTDVDYRIDDLKAHIQSLPSPQPA